MRLPLLSRRSEAGVLAAVIAAAVAIRVAAILLLGGPVVDDAASYLEMARSALAPGEPMHDVWGNRAFFSPGYPLLLALPVRLLGATLATVQAVNLLLAAASTWLVHRLARRLGAPPIAALAAAAFYAALVPLAASAAGIERENLSVPLLLGFAAAAAALAYTPRPRRLAATAGILWGAGLLAGASSVLTAAAIPAALLLRREGWRAMIAPALAFAAASALVVAPWLLHVDRALGRPALTSNAPFNLYVGNNPAATGWFVSLRDTPVGPHWHAMRRRLGEDRATRALGAMAVEHIRAHPAETAALAARKLLFFWAPNLPDAADHDTGAIRLIRWIDVAQHLAVLAMLLALAGSWPRRSAPERVVIVALAAFWAVHAGAYVIPRYRLPAIPLVLALAAAAVRDPATARRAARLERAPA